jgi:hypothetical protein
MGYEYLIYKLISAYASTLEKESQIKNLFHLTDERLLWTLYENKKTNKDISKIAKRLLLHEIPFCYGILKSNHFYNKSILDDINCLKSLEEKINLHLNNTGINSSVFIHMTTDNRKTNRKIDFYSIEQDKKIVKQSIELSSGDTILNY